MPRESRTAVEEWATREIRLGWPSHLCLCLVLCSAFVLTVSGGKWLNTVDSVVPLPCGFRSERMVEGVAAQEKACCRDTSWTERECWKREISRTSCSAVVKNKSSCLGWFICSVHLCLGNSLMRSWSEGYSVLINSMLASVCFYSEVRSLILQ